MKSTWIAAAASVLAATLGFGATGGAPDAASAYARLKTLAGEWEAQTPMGVVHSSYRLIAGGSALEERITADKMPEMLTVYYLDGDRLLLTHYCMTGNQPRMQTTAFDPATGDIQFGFLDATNLASPAATHMHTAHLRLADDRHLRATWELYQDGKPARSEEFAFTRVP